MDLRSNQGGNNAAAMQAATDAKNAADAAMTRANNAMTKANAAQTKTAATDTESTQDAKIAAAQALAEQANARAMTPGPKGDAGAASTVAGPKGDKGDTGPSGQVITAVGHTVTGALLLGGNASYVITLSRTMPDTNYLVDFIRSSGLAVGKAALEVTARTTTTCTVKVTATLALIAADLNVIAHY